MWVLQISSFSVAGFGFWGMYLVIYTVKNPLAPGAVFFFFLLGARNHFTGALAHFGSGSPSSWGEEAVCKLGVRPVTVLEALGAVAPSTVQLRELVSFY